MPKLTWNLRRTTTAEYVEDINKLVGDGDEGEEKPLDAEWVNSSAPSGKLA